MKNKKNCVCAIVSILIFSALLVGFTFSGDRDLDSALSELNVNAKMDFGDYKTEICLGYNISESKFDYFSGTIKMEPADIYMAAELSMITKTPIDKVIVTYQANKGKGWGQIAKELGIKPGSAEFKALKGKAHSHNAKIKEKSKNKGKKNKNK